MVIFLGSLVLGGCFDVAQHVTKNSSGEIVSFVRFTFDKSLFSITEQMSGEPVDYSTMLTDADLTENDFIPQPRDTWYSVSARVIVVFSTFPEVAT